MGQRLFFPPSVAGWPGGLAWLDGQAIVARTNFAAWLTEPSTWRGKNPFASLAERHGLRTPDEWLDALATLLLSAALSTTSRMLCEHQRPDRHLMTRRLLSSPEAQVG